MVEPIGDIELCHVHRPLIGVGMLQQPKDAGERASELHNFGWQLDHSVVIDAKPGVIHNDVGSAFLSLILDR